MRTQIVLMFGLICLLIISLGMYASADLVGYWPFDEGSGDVTKDLSGKGNDGQLVNNPQWVAGKYGMALQFDSDSGDIGSYVEIPNMGAIGAGDFTAMAWFKIEETEMDTSKLILCTGSCCWNQAGFYICLRPGGRITFELTETNGTGGKAINLDGVNTLDGKWHHIAGVYLFGTKASLYVDGNFGADVDMSEYKDGVASDRPLRIAEYFWQEDTRLNFDGVIDEVALFDTALTEAEIAVAMQSIVPAAVRPAGKLAATWGCIKAE